MTRLRSLFSRLLASFIQHARLCVVLAAVFGAWPAHADGGTITGTVTSAATGTPIASVTVYIYTSSRQLRRIDVDERRAVSTRGRTSRPAATT